MSDEGLRMRALVVQQSLRIIDVLRVLGREVAHDGTQQILCPNPQHPERHPSARLYVESNSVHCFVCGRTWDVVGLVGVVKQVSPGQAVQWLEEIAGITEADGLALIEAAMVMPPRRSLGQLFQTTEQVVHAAKPRLPAARYHRLWIALDWVAYQYHHGQLDMETAEAAVAGIERVVAEGVL